MVLAIIGIVIFAVLTFLAARAHYKAGNWDYAIAQVVVFMLFLLCIPWWN